MFELVGREVQAPSTYFYSPEAVENWTAIRPSSRVSRAVCLAMADDDGAETTTHKPCAALPLQSN